jgi:hypothetical protein
VLTPLDLYVEPPKGLNLDLAQPVDLPDILELYRRLLQKPSPPAGALLRHNKYFL